ncbi:MAG: pyridoxal-dependent decarboxylase [Desulfobacteraceae bacterium]|nr:pyridoxal-dependent decarboxylase [Desulfobacteraceae bacterium]
MTDKPDIHRIIRSQLATKALFDQARSHAFEYMDTLHDRPVYPSPETLENLSVFDEPLPDAMGDPEKFLALLHTYGSPATVAQTGNRYFGFVNGGVTPAAVAAKWLADVWDQNAGLFVMSPIAARLEAVCERWLVDLFDLPETTRAGFVSGTSTATLCGLAAARNFLLARAGWDVHQKGLNKAPELKVVLGEEAHSTVFKALSLLGFGLDNLIRVKTDGQGRMKASDLPDLDAATLVIAQAGNVNTGAFDPFHEICGKAQKARAWVHIDGAFGLWAQGSENTKHLTGGIEKADSWSVDAHKTLNAPYDCGIVLCRDESALVSALQNTGAYIQYGQNRDSMLYTPEMSRRARSVELWATLKCFGRKGIEILVDGLCGNARLFAQELEKQEFHILNDIHFNQVLVSCGDDALTQAVLAEIKSGGVCWCGGSAWKGRSVIRISVCSWATTAQDVHMSVKAFVEARTRALSKQTKKESK